jgi:hypothetical protein
MTHNLTNEQQQLITMYINQYNQTNNHIDQLLDMLDETRNNIMSVLSRGQPRRTRRTRINHYSRNFDTNINQFNNQVLDEHPNPHIRYDYNNPISPQVYTTQYFNTNRNRNRNRNTNTNNTNTNNTNTNNTNRRNHSEPLDLSTFFTNFLNTNVIIRPTREQVENASRLIRYRDIENPISETCPIS